MISYSEIEWDDYNIFKNDIEHGVKYWEIEQCFENTYVVFKGKKKKHSKGKEIRKAILGRTDAGRYLLVIFEDKGKGRARPISARDMEDNERSHYEKKAGRV